MSSHQYKRTNFDDDEQMLAESPGHTVHHFSPPVTFKVSLSCWGRRTLLERFLLVATLLLLLVVLILSCVIGSRSSAPEGQSNVVAQSTPKAADRKMTSPSPGTLPAASCPPPSSPVCLNKTCVTVASTIINSMNFSENPCNDFYNYACGGWIRSHPIPPGQSRWATFGVLWKENQIILRNALEDNAGQGSEDSAEKKAYAYYQSCIDTNKVIDSLKASPMLDLLQTVFGSRTMDVSLLDGADSRQAFQSLVTTIHGYGLSPFFTVWVGEDEKNSSVNIFQVDQSGLGLPRDQYINKTKDSDPILKAYWQYMVTICENLGWDKTAAEQAMSDVIDFESQIALITMPEEDRRDDEKLYNKMTLASLQQIAPFIDWTGYFNTLLSVTDKRITVTSDEPAIVFGPVFMANISAMVMQKLQTAQGRSVLIHYARWHFVKYFVSYLSKSFIDAKKAFNEVLTGVTGDEEKWRTCISDTDSTIGFALGAMFVREAFHGESKTTAEEMIKEVREAFKKNLPTLRWMDAETRRAAEEKADAVIDMIGFPEYIRNATALDEKYKGLTFKENEYFGNNVREMKFGVKETLNKLRQTPDKSTWSMTPPTINAYYSPTRNEIVFPAGILQAPFYDKDYPKSLNFGAMGVVMGHELTHGFDDQGREYDKSGILRSWWNKAVIERFQTQAQCMVDQYSQYKVNNEPVRGKQTLGENIADNGGLKSAYYAYLDWLKDHGEEAPLPGLELTHKQLFFVAFAQVWCANTKPQTQHMGILTDPHSPERFRVIGPLSNSEEFAREFNCPRDSPMNPSKKCLVW